MKGIFVVLLGLAVAGLLVLSTRDGGSIPAPSDVGGSGGAKQTSDGASSAPVTDNSWIAEASREPVEIEFVGSKGGSVTVESRGKLDGASRYDLQRHLEQGVAAAWTNWENMCNGRGSGADGEKTLQDAVREMEQLVGVKRAEAALDCYRRNEYMTFAAGSGEVNSIRIPPGHFATRTYNGGYSDGKSVDVIVITADEHPIVKEITDQLTAMQVALNSSELLAFNQLAVADRQRRIEAHRASVAAARQLRSRQDLSQEDREVMFSKLVPTFLPARWQFTQDYHAYMN